MSKAANKVCLIVIDGWGENPNTSDSGDAIRTAKTPYMDMLKSRYPNRDILAHGNAVGLPEGLMGNSEVGHLNIGAGRVVFQDIVRIDLALKKKQFGLLPNIKHAFEQAINKSGRLHLCGLVSDGGVHSHINHLFGLLAAAKEAGVPETFVHFFCDGRDTNPRSSEKYMKQLLDEMNRINYGKVATVVGRYYAMDRDRRWERIQIAYNGMVLGEGEYTDDVVKTIQERYDQDLTDEFLKPIIVNKEGLIRGLLSHYYVHSYNDTLFFFNYRSDRMREISQAFGISPPPFEANVPKDLDIITMTQYKSDFPFLTAFPPQKMDNSLAEWLDKKGLTQSHVAETEKYAHVTFFFNGGSEVQFKNENRVLIPSPKVATYDLMPQMSAIPVAEAVVSEMDSQKYDFVMCNFAPPDMVGHTGIYEAAKTAIEATDKAIGIIYEGCVKNSYVLFVTSDHGNAEVMTAADGSPHTAHTCNRVPLIITSNNVHLIDADSELDALCDVAPTILSVMGVEAPEEMTGRSLAK
ncbi:2,3-bisphosphoglycerate-independent phosphoglycerate mutase [Smittium mucronatum]|uniref:2,3-bisphosphoglycerate-independent phosphoglycerate mutase n=1 Tax=Smittium mucronatum TaxID=133383 RepID=A0A1R0GYK6_9FUNG|nr:2,3-bisphosphoglycerate-independent phosphoglycerate mutase [Smittium mucronatum]OLY81994.1 2,3-bisphosphoglycerate-independent phosphoglycerate mutase [Smittium mucronatum]